MRHFLQSLLPLKASPRGWRCTGLLTIFLLLFLFQPIHSQTVDVTITSDNAYVFGFGDGNGIATLPFPNGVDNCVASDIYDYPETYTSIPAGLNDYIYIVAWSDESVYQGTIAQFSDGTTTILTQPGLAKPWEVYATGTDINPNCSGGFSAPSLANINFQIGLANTSSGPVGSSVTWVNENSTGSNGRLEFDPYINNSGSNPNGPFPPGDVSGIGPAQWMWYNPNPGVITDPFVGAVTGEYLIFRIGLDVINPPTGDWINKDLKMIMVGGATGVNVLLEGNVLPLDWHYDGLPYPNQDWGVFNSFQAGLDANGNTLLEWSDFVDGDNSVIDPDQIIHVGWRPNGPNNVLSLWWTWPKAGSNVQQNIWQVSAHGKVNGVYFDSVVWHNTFAPDGIPDNTLTITDVQFAVFATPVSPASLNRWNSELESALQPMPGGAVIPLPYDQFVTLPFPYPIHTSEWVVVKYTVDGVGTAAEVTDYVLLAPPSPQNGAIPTLTEWGMIIFCALLFAWMAWVLVRRKKQSVQSC